MINFLISFTYTYCFVMYAFAFKHIRPSKDKIFIAFLLDYIFIGTLDKTFFTETKREITVEAICTVESGISKQSKICEHSLRLSPLSPSLKKWPQAYRVR